MKPPYQITAIILQLVASISEKLGEVNAIHLHKPPTELRKKNRIKTIQSSLEIEGNTLTEEQITALLENNTDNRTLKDDIERADLFLRAGKHQEAEAAFKNAIALSDNDSEIRYLERRLSTI